ncbi:uncharacterized protein LOC107420988 [Ziziphus jujuba]|uniref:Uncharacterized protein LOC107420988 n=1 Tax=Ziziphus jujuba TaxID=326968 RepID=A0ABM3IMN4_ZIZJJ|nr:uncharacterized protein LOC107420988 [Ziziphus jujuba]
MESSSLSSEASFSPWDYLSLFLLRPVSAVLFVFLLISLGWLLAWKLVLVHVPLVQEIFGLRKKPVKPKPLTRRLSKIYSNIDSRKNASGCICQDQIRLLRILVEGFVLLILPIQSELIIIKRKSKLQELVHKG